MTLPGRAWILCRTSEASTPGSAWRAPAFDDAGWATGAAPFRYGDGAGGTDPDVNHVYTQAGLYTVSFDVRTALQAARCATT